MTSITTIENWEANLEKRWFAYPVDGLDLPVIKDFIRALLKSNNETLAAMIEGKEMEVPEPPEDQYDDSKDYYYAMGFNDGNKVAVQFIRSHPIQ